MLYEEKIVNYFWDHVAVCTHGLSCQDCCWLWTGTCNPQGYGVITVYDKAQYARTKCGVRTLKAPRVALELATGALLPKGIWALHACNNPPCCNPNTCHVYQGTPQRNAHDTVATGHHVSNFPEPHGHYKHSFETIQTLRHLAMAGFPYSILEKIFDIPSGYISVLVLRKQRINK